MRRSRFRARIGRRAGNRRVQVKRGEDQFRRIHERVVLDPVQRERTLEALSMDSIDIVEAPKLRLSLRTIGMTNDQRGQTRLPGHQAQVLHCLSAAGGRRTLGSQ